MTPKEADALVATLRALVAQWLTPGTDPFLVRKVAPDKEKCAAELSAVIDAVTAKNP